VHDYAPLVDLRRPRPPPAAG